MAAFTKEVETHFGFLRSAGYEVLANEASTSFDNGLAIFRSTWLSIQVVRDRGDWFFEAGPLGGLRYGDHLLAEVLSDASRAPTAVVDHRDPAALARHLQHMLPSIEAAFGPDQSAHTIAALSQAGELRWKRMLSGFDTTKRAT